MSSVGEDEIMSESKYVLLDMEKASATNPASVFSKTTPKKLPVSTDFRDTNSLD